MAESTCRVIELDEGSEVKRVESNEYIFDKIGAPVPLAAGDSRFDLSNIPSQPLVVSEQRQLLFIAHSDGFLVVKTEDVINSAKEIKEQGTGPSLREICVVDILIGKINVLAMSKDSEMVAACVGGDIHFFLVDSLLKEEQTPYSSCSLGESEYVKDMKWTIRNGKSYIVLSKSGKLYNGVIGGSLQHVFDNVDAVEWSVNQRLYALARKNIISILSPDFKETLSMSLRFHSEVYDACMDYTVKVDSIWWARPDCIILGSLQVTTEGTEENYLVQAISSRGGGFTDTSSEPVVSTFDELFTGIIDDIVPFGSGPYLFLSYLRQCELGIIANKKNVDQHINLIGWSSEDSNSEVAIIDFNRDKWAPRIPLQDNDDDNVVVGLCTDEVSLYGKVRFQQGVEDPRELSPYCVIFCLTLEGKMIIFHLASTSYTPTRHQGTLFSDEDISAPTLDIRQDQSKLDSETEHPNKGSALDQLQMEGREEGPKRNIFADSKMNHPTLWANTVVHTETKSAGAKMHEPAGQPISPLQNQVAPTESTNMGLQKTDRNKISEGITNLSKADCAGLPKTDWSKNSQGTDNLSQVDHSSLQKTDLNTKFQGTNNLGRGDHGFRDGTKLISSTASSDASFRNSLNSHMPNKDVKKVTDSGSIAGSKFGMGFTSNFPGESLFSFPSSGQSHKDESRDARVDGRDIYEDSVPKHSSFNDAPNSTYPFQPSAKIASSGSINLSNRIEALPSVRNSLLLFQQQNTSDNGFRSGMENYRARPLSGNLTSEASLSKGSINIREMTEQLDKLLKDIEDTGGFVDSTTDQTNLAVELSQGLEALAGECNTWKSILKERYEEIQDLLSKTVQVLARKTYVEGIIKQASDSQYLDLWNRKGLGSELEMKRGNIIKIHQEMTNQLIQLETHFNNLELNKFGQKDGAGVSYRGRQSQLREPRHLQSLNSLQNAMNSQLVVAEQLSKCLSDQMALLKVDSPISKQQNVKRDLFKTIGLPLDATSFSSPGYSSLEKHSGPSSSASVKDQAKLCKTIGYKSPEPETARRRRDSLGRSWAVFEPHKTTIRRTPLREGRKPDVEKPLSIPHMLEKSISSQQKERITPSTLHPSRNKVGQDALKVEESKSSISQLKWVNNDKGLQTGCIHSPAKANSMPVLSSSISSKLLFGQSSGKTTGGLISEKAVFRGSSGNDPHDIKLESPADTKDGKANMDAPFKTFMMPQSHLNETPKPTAQWNFTMPTKGAGNQSAHVFVASEAPALGRKAPDFNEGSSRSQSGTDVISLPTSSSPPTQLSLFSSVSVSAAPTLFPISSITKSSPLSDDSLNTKSDSVAGKLMFPVSTSFSSSTPLSEKLKLPEQPLNGASQSDRATEKQQQEKFPPLMATPSVSEPPTSNVFAPKPVDSLPQAEITKSSEKGKSQLNVGGESVPPTSNIFAPKPDNSLAQAAITNNSDKGKSQLNVGGESVPRTSGFSFNDPAVSEPKVKIQEEGKSSEKFSFGGIADDGMNSIQKSKLEQPLPATNGSAATEKTDSSLNTGYQEDEMEEEAPETSPVAELSLGSLGGFGLGSTPTQAAATPNRNPFGGSFINPSASPPSSPFTSSSAGGELFRPASFSFSPTQSTQTPQPATSSFGGFGSSTTPVGFGFAANQAPSGGGFGQPAQAGQGIQALGSVLGSFGQSRQIGIGQPINSFAPATGFGSGFTSTQSAGGFANAATKPSGFAALASNSGGFAALASNSGGFAAATSGGNTPGGFAGAASSTGGGGFGGFAGAAAPTGGSGFGGFAGAGGVGGFGQQGSSFSAFGSGTGAQPPPQLFTQMRK